MSADEAPPINIHLSTACLQEPRSKFQDRTVLIIAAQDLLLCERGKSEIYSCAKHESRAGEPTRAQGRLHENSVVATSRSSIHAHCRSEREGAEMK